jgi:hypothetical protein
MTRKTLRRAGLLVGAMLLLAMGPLAGQAVASHFRHGNLNWMEASGAPAGSQRITVQYEQSWRWSAFGQPAQGSVIANSEGCIDWGDGTAATCPQYLVEFVNASEDYMRVQALAPGSTTDTNVPHDYADPAGTFTISTGSCCTISTLNNANDASWNILATVNLAGDDESAVSTIPAIVTLAPGGVRTFNVPANDAGGETLFFRLSDADESCVGCSDPHPPGISINSSTGQVTLDTTGLDGLNWTGVVIESRNAQGQVVATSHIQYIIRVAATGGNQPPVWDSPPTPADGAVFTVAPGESVNFTMQASDPDSGDTVSILKNSGPGTFTATDGNPATGAFSFTAQNSDLGNDYIVQFIAQDQNGDGPPFRSYTIRVRAATGGTEGPPGDPTCSDGQDNDGDGLIDGDDPDCQTGQQPQCSDGVDNDGDGKADFNHNPFHGDTGCSSPQDTSESPNPQCSDGVDNDGDGKTDWQRRRGHGDRNCSSLRDNSEAKRSPRHSSARRRH